MASIISVPTVSHQSANSWTPTWLAVGGVPGEIEAGRPLVLGADAVFPVVGRDEVAAGIADHRDIEVLHQLGDVAAHAVLVGGGMIGLVDTGVDGAAEVLEERAVNPAIDL